MTGKTEMQLITYIFVVLRHRVDGLISTSGYSGRILLLNTVVALARKEEKSYPLTLIQDSRSLLKFKQDVSFLLKLNVSSMGRPA